VAPQQRVAQEAEEAAAWGLLGQAASPEEEGAGREAGEGAGRGWTTGLAAPEATWLVGLGLQGLDQTGEPPAWSPAFSGTQVCQ
jgi:hypothetical protein